VFRLNGAYNSLAVEFADHILPFEPGPQNEARAQAVIAEEGDPQQAHPLRRDLASFDHTSALRAVAAVGITIVTQEVNKAFLASTVWAPRRK
jgi:hypothetical protein